MHTEKSVIEQLQRGEEDGLHAFTVLYGNLCKKIARDITGSTETAEECYNDLLLTLWNTIPPEKPASLKSYACRIIRNRALNEAEKQNAAKRSAVYAELDECCEGIEDIEDTELGELLDVFLKKQPKLSAYVFVRRYYYSEPVSEIARAVGKKENQISKILVKMRKELKKYLAGGGEHL